MCFDGGPDEDPGVAQAAKEQAQIGRDALAYFKEKDLANAPRQAALDEISGKVAAQQLDTSQFLTQQAKDQYQRYLEKGVPVEDQMFKDAMTYDSAAKQEEAAGQASADVQSNLTAGKAATTREMARMGVNPNSARFQATSAAGDITGALAEAGAENAAKVRVRDTGIALRKDATTVARSMPASAIAAYGVAGNAANGATAAATAPIAASNATTATTGTGFGIGSNAIGAGGNLLLQQQKIQQDAESQKDAALMSLAGTAAGVASAYGSRRSTT